MPIEKQIVQIGHALYEAASLRPDNIEHPHFVLLAVANEEKLLRVADKLNQAGIDFKLFNEIDLNSEYTALATSPVYGETRHIFKRYSLLKGV